MSVTERVQRARRGRFKPVPKNHMPIVATYYVNGAYSNDTMDRQDQPSGGQPPKSVSILFVCLGNICRSPMAEGAFRHLTNFGTPQQHPLIAHIDSCGTGAYHAGDLSDTRTMSVLKDNGITDYRHQARKVTIEDFREYDYVLGMDEDNVEDLRDLVKRAAKKGALSGDEAGRIHMYGEFGGKTKGEEIGDPYYGGRDGFEVAYEQVTRFGKALLRHIEVEAAKELGSSVP